MFFPDKCLGEYAIGKILLGKVNKLNIGRREKALSEERWAYMCN